MGLLTPEIWGILAALIGIAVIAALYTLAAFRRDHVALHDLKLRVHTLHQEYVDRLAAMKARAAEEVSGPAPAQAAPPTVPVPEAAEAVEVAEVVEERQAA